MIIVIVAVENLEFPMFVGTILSSLPFPFENAYIKIEWTQARSHSHLFVSTSLTDSHTQVYLPWKVTSSRILDIRKDIYMLDTCHTQRDQ